MSRARELAKLGNQNLLKLDTDNTRVGIASTAPGFTLDVGSGKIRGDGSELIGISAKASFAGLIESNLLKYGPVKKVGFANAAQHKIIHRNCIRVMNSINIDFI